MGGGSINFPDAALGLIDLVAGDAVGFHDFGDGPLLDDIGVEERKLLGRDRGSLGLGAAGNNDS